MILGCIPSSPSWRSGVEVMDTRIVVGAVAVVVHQNYAEGSAPANRTPVYGPAAVLAV